MCRKTFVCLYVRLFVCFSICETYLMKKETPAVETNPCMRIFHQYIAAAASLEYSRCDLN